MFGETTTTGWWAGCHYRYISVDSQGWNCSHWREIFLNPGEQFPRFHVGSCHLFIDGHVRQCAAESFSPTSFDSCRLAHSKTCSGDLQRAILSDTLSVVVLMTWLPHKWQTPNTDNSWIDIALLVPICQLHRLITTVRNRRFTGTSELFVFVIHVSVFHSFGDDLSAAF